MECSSSSFHKSIIYNHKSYTNSVKIKSLNRLQQPKGPSMCGVEKIGGRLAWHIEQWQGQFVWLWENPSFAFSQDRVGLPSPSYAPSYARCPNWPLYIPLIGRRNRECIADALILDSTTTLII